MSRTLHARIDLAGDSSVTSGPGAPGSWVVACRTCGFRSMPISFRAAQEIAWRHDSQVHWRAPRTPEGGTDAVQESRAESLQESERADVHEEASGGVSRDGRVPTKTRRASQG